MHNFVFRRLLGLLNSTSGDIICGGDSNEATLYIAPTVIANVSSDDKIMQVSYKTWYFCVHYHSINIGGDLWSNITHYHGGKFGWSHQVH